MTPVFLMHTFTVIWTSSSSSSSPLHHHHQCFTLLRTYYLGRDSTYIKFVRYNSKVSYCYHVTSIT